MTETGTPRIVEGLPKTIPIFPLTGVLLLPRGQLPLNIFEPRYLHMTADALGGARIIGMVQPRSPGAEAREEAPEVYGVGCAGRITAFRETADGRYEIELTGFSRFEIGGELPDETDYRRVRAQWDRFREDLREDTDACIERDALLEKLHRFLALREMEADWAALEQFSDDALVTWLAMYGPFEPNERQALLEAPDRSERARILDALLEIAAREPDMSDLPQ